MTLSMTHVRIVYLKCLFVECENGRKCDVILLFDDFLFPERKKQQKIYGVGAIARSGHEWFARYES